MAQTIRLQGLGVYVANLASEIRVGSILMWNFGQKSEVISINKESEKCIWITERSIESGYQAERRLMKGRAVCIVGEKANG